MVAGPSMTAHAADTTLTLACQGTTISGVEDAKPEPVSMGIIVNFTNLRPDKERPAWTSSE
jgi:hypothetical protein